MVNFFKKLFFKLIRKDIKKSIEETKHGEVTQEELELILENWLLHFNDYGEDQDSKPIKKKSDK